MAVQQYIVPEEKNNIRLCDYLREIGYSRAMLRRMIRGGGVMVNGEFHRNIDPITTGDIIEIDFPDKDAVLTPNPDLNIPIAYEDDNVLVFEKPDDILVHPATREFDDALGNYFAALYPGIPFRALGRLDRHTTGLCLIAKNKLTSVQLGTSIQKEYLAIADGVFTEEYGTVDAPLLRVPGSTIMRVVDPSGQPSVTHFRVVKQRENYALIHLHLETGRTHQIRVHMAYLGHPLSGDTLYGGDNTLIKRSALHCSKMTWILNGEKKTVESPLPDDMEKLL